MRQETLFSAALLPAEASAVGIISHVKLRKGENLELTQLRLVSNFVMEELFDALDLLLGGLLDEVPFESRKNLVVQRLGDPNRLLHIALPTLIPVELDDGSFKGDANYLDYEPLVHELTYHLERKSAQKPLSTKPNAALDSADMWLALLRGLITVGIDTIEHDKENQHGTAELVARLRKILANARLGATITAAGNWVNAQHLMGEWRARLLVGTAIADGDLIASDKPITFLVPYYLAAICRTLVQQHSADTRLGLDATWAEDTIVTGIQGTEFTDDDDNNDNDDGEDDDDGAPPRPPRDSDEL